MKKNLLNLSSRLDPVAAEILAIISRVTLNSGIPFFIVGATARDLFFESRRATIDLDLGIQIASWKLYDDLFDELIKTGNFRRTSTVHRILYIRSNNEYPVDMVPFGSISEAQGIISWPDQKQMSILGFEEAYEESYQINIGGVKGNTLRVASPIGLVIMKLISWSESTDRAEKDAQDLELIFSNYHSIFNNSERVFDYPKIMKSVEFDLQRAGTVLLGMDAGKILKENNTEKYILSILGKEIDSSKSTLSIDMMSKNRINENEYDQKLQTIRDFKIGFDLQG